MKISSLHNMTLEEIDAVHRRSRDFDQSLLDDLENAKGHLSANDTSFARRTYCRTLLALFEGMVSNLKRQVLMFESHALGKDEIQLLQKRLGALDLAFHSFDLYTNCAGAVSPLEKHSPEWHVLKRAIKIRNRITHPASDWDLEITGLELGFLRMAEETIFKLVYRCIEDSAKAQLRRLRALRNRRKEFLGQSVRK
jgi:hypothetical protein